MSYGTVSIHTYTHTHRKILQNIKILSCVVIQMELGTYKLETERQALHDLTHLWMLSQLI